MKMGCKTFIFVSFACSACFFVQGKVLLFDKADDSHQFTIRKDDSVGLMPHRIRAENTVAEFLQKLDSEPTSDRKTSDASQCGYDVSWRINNISDITIGCASA